MKRTLSLLLLFVLIFIPAKAGDVQDVKPTKNVILFISDGTSLASISTARWLQWYTNPDKPKLNIDPYLCGTVRTHSSNAPIGDSAPTTSCYMSGQPSITGFVSTYPYACGQDIQRSRYRSGIYLRISARYTGRLLRTQLQSREIRMDCPADGTQ